MDKGKFQTPKSPTRRQQLSALEPYTVAEVSALTGFSAQTVTRMFENEKGTLVINRPTTMNKRRYRSIRIHGRFTSAW